ncbi:MAG: hypothetical protein AUK44_05015 [Porphyromonadaceae bacterium CG2_30_38_12]|nr:MAG: hypothetical protein AUK44_05015 [Porphyromonadaceae bacterium CG2_30_38_12]
MDFTRAINSIFFFDWFFDKINSSFAEIFNVDMMNLSVMGEKMAYDGDWKLFFNFFTEQIYKQTSVRDFMDCEKTVKMFHLVYLNLVNYFTIHSEAESQLHRYAADHA